jgi:putative flippase GtrA
VTTETSAPDMQSDRQGQARQESPDGQPSGSRGASRFARFLPDFLQREHLFGQIVRFAVVGGLNTIVDYSLFNLLHHVFGWPLLVSNTISVSMAIVNSFLWNRYWTFSARRSGGWQRREVLAFLLVSLIGLAINNGGFWLLHNTWGGSSVLATNLQKAGASIISLVWNFVGYRLLAFRGPKRRGTPT